MFDLRLVFDRLQKQVKTLSFIGDAIDLADTKKLESRAKPSAYIELKNIITLGEGDKRLALLRGKKRQFVAIRFSVTVVAKNIRYQPSSSIDTLESVIEDIHHALIGWNPEVSMARSCELESGLMKFYNGKILAWQDNYQLLYAVGSDL